MNPRAADEATIIDLFRHGAPEGGERYRGGQDDPLSPQGWEQMWQAVGGYAAWGGIVSSPLRRCADFARELAVRLTLTGETEPGFREISFGAWEGRSREEILATEREQITAFWRDPLHHTPPGGEPMERFTLRVVDAWEKMVLRYQGQHVLLVTHGGVIRLILSHVLNMPRENLSRILVPYASLSRIRVEEQFGVRMPRLVFHGGRLE